MESFSLSFLAVPCGDQGSNTEPLYQDHEVLTLGTREKSLRWEDSLKKGKATHSSILDWRIPWTVWSMGSQRVRHDCATFTLSFKKLELKF